MKLLIERMSHTGDGIGKINGKVYFVSKTIVGDVVEIKRIIDGNSYARASVDSFIKKSRDRVSVKCPYYDRCGGCQIMDYSYEKQLKYKKDKVKSIFKKYGNIEINPEIIYGKQFGYRNKIVLRGGLKEFGLYENRSRKIVDIDKCLLVSDNINEIIRVIRDKIDVSMVNEVTIREGSNGILISFSGFIRADEIVEVLKDKVVGILANGEILYGKRKVIQKIGKYEFKLGIEDFLQVNNEMMIKLYDKILEYLGEGNERVLDLYCGVGTIGTYISGMVGEVVGIEVNEYAIMDARDSKRRNGLKNIMFKQGEVSKRLKNDNDYDVVIVDPPRSGLDKITRDILLDIGSKKIIYVSCNPMTLVRDINYFKDKYEMVDICLVDMFPNTYHVECVCMLSLR